MNLLITTFRIEGDDVSEGGFEEGAVPSSNLTKDFGTFFFDVNLGFTGGVAADGTDDATVEVKAVLGGTTYYALEDMDDFPLT